MRLILTSLLFALLLAGNAGASPNQQVDVGFSFNDKGLQSFYLAIGDYYRVPEQVGAVGADLCVCPFWVNGQIGRW